MQHRRPAGMAIRSALPPLQHLDAAQARHHPVQHHHIRARNAATAAEEAQLELAVQCPDFDPASARLVATKQVL